MSGIRSKKVTGKRLNIDTILDRDDSLNALFKGSRILYAANKKNMTYDEYTAWLKQYKIDHHAAYKHKLTTEQQWKAWEGKQIEAGFVKTSIGKHIIWERADTRVGKLVK